MKAVKQFIFLMFLTLIPITSAYAQQKLIVRNSETGESFEVEIPDGLSITADGWTDSVNVYRERARRGEVDAYKKLAWCYENGIGVEKDFINMICMFELAGERSGKSSMYFLLQSQLGRQIEEMSVKVQNNDSIGAMEIFDSVIREWPSFRSYIKTYGVTDKNELLQIIESEAGKGDRWAEMVLASLAVDSVCSDANIRNLEDVAAYAPMMYNKLGRIYMGLPDSTRTDIDRAIGYFKKADEYAMLSWKGSRALLECYRIKMEKGETPCDEKELSRLKLLSGYSGSAEAE